MIYYEINNTSIIIFNNKDGFTRYMTHVCVPRMCMYTVCVRVFLLALRHLNSHVPYSTFGM
jgi:hypothetical protein